MRALDQRCRSMEAEAEPASADTDGQVHGDDEEDDLRVSTLLSNRRQMVTMGIVFVLAVAAIYFVFPMLVGLEDALVRLGQASLSWIAVAIAFNIAAFAAYVALFRGILGGRHDDELHRRLGVRASYEITMAGLAATRLFSAAGAGGIVLTYWALRKAGMPRRRSACRMVAFLVLTYSVYLATVVVFGVLLHAGVLPGADPVAGTIVPAALAAGAIALLGLVARIPGDFERRLAAVTGEGRVAWIAEKLAPAPATVATGVRTALDYVGHPRRGALAVAGAVGFWAGNIGVLWASFEAFGGDVPFAVLVQCFFLGMAANLIPSPAGGVGSVDAGMIGAFVLFGVDQEIVFPAVLTYRVIAFWLPIPPGIVAYFQLRRTVAGWEEERRYTSESKVNMEAS